MLTIEQSTNLFYNWKKLLFSELLSIDQKNYEILIAIDVTNKRGSKFYIDLKKITLDNNNEISYLGQHEIKTRDIYHLNTQYKKFKISIEKKSIDDFHNILIKLIHKYE